MAQALVVTKLAYEHGVWDVYIGIGEGLHKSPVRECLAGMAPLGSSQQRSLLMGSNALGHLMVV